ncbi:hypothetical protein MJM04_28795, partial [Salmonella enterica subsp. enterica serovar Cerro]|nr:hypothetical protein [Salmonella enterica subsp. enterica serovar Cerro]
MDTQSKSGVRQVPSTEGQWKLLRLLKQQLEEMGLVNSVDLSLFKSRNFTIGCLCISLAYMLYFGAIVLLPQLLQEVYGY